MNCDQFSEDYELYALGLLETPERDELETVFLELTNREKK